MHKAYELTYLHLSIFEKGRIFFQCNELWQLNIDQNPKKVQKMFFIDIFSWLGSNIIVFSAIFYRTSFLGVKFDRLSFWGVRILIFRIVVNVQLPESISLEEIYPFLKNR